jgi:hypothetical protein
MICNHKIRPFSGDSEREPFMGVPLALNASKAAVERLGICRCNSGPSVPLGEACTAQKSLHIVSLELLAEKIDNYGRSTNDRANQDRAENVHTRKRHILNGRRIDSRGGK